MKRLITTLALAAILAVPAGALADGTPGNPYAWTISASNTNELVNTTAFVPGLASYYLWLACCNLPDGLQQGMSAAEFSIAMDNAANLILAFTPTSGYLNAGGATNLLLAVGGCPCGPVPAGIILSLMNAPGQLNITPAPNGNKVKVDCETQPQAWPIDWIGLGIGVPNAGKGDACKFTSVEATTWGAIKGLYR